MSQNVHLGFFHKEQAGIFRLEKWMDDMKLWILILYFFCCCDGWANIFRNTNSHII